MLKHASIIRQLTDSDKIHLLSDIRHLSNKEYKVLGIPSVKIGYWNDYCQDDYPTMAEISHSWDTELIAHAARAVFARMVQDDVTLAMIPGPKPRINPFRQALCEDPVLARTLTDIYLAAAKENGLCCCICDFSLHNDELEWIDTPPDTQAIQEYIIKPYIDVANKAACAAVLLEYVSDETTPNHLFYDAVKSNQLGAQTVPLFRSIPEEHTVRAITHGDLCIKCSATALESAVKRYRQLKKIIGDGSSAETLTQECTQGTAISPETLDIATDRVIEFAHSIKRLISASDAIDPSLPLTVAKHSTVLLKNKQSRLPLSTDKSVCILGDLYTKTEDDSFANLAEQVAHQLTQLGYTVIGTARGYDSKTDRSEHLIPDAIALADQADAVIVLLGPDATAEANITRLKNPAIPANQQQLLDSLREQQSKVIAVLPGAYSLDIGMADCCAAILQAPLRVKQSAVALAQVISGKYSPGGKLANTVYLNSLKQHAIRKNLRHRDGMKVGPFMGYRYYDREHSNPGFSFGHGLGYSSFVYSQFSISGDTVRLTVTNQGAHSGVEIVQAYVGIQDLTRIRPAKELAAFTKVVLKPGEQKTVELTLNWPLVYSPDDRRWVREQADYTVSVGTSLSHIQWEHTVALSGEPLKEEYAKISDYIPSESNILIDQFTLEAKRKPMKKSAFNFVAGALSLALAIALKLYCQFTDNNTAFFNIFALILLFSGVSFFIKEAVNRNHAYHMSEHEQQQANEALFEQAETLPVYSAQSMFVKEFDEVEEIAQEADHYKDEIDSNAMAHVDKDYTLSVAIEDFIRFAAERGYHFSEQTVANIFSSLTSSRLAVVYDMDQNRFRTFMSVLSSFFESPLYLDATDAQYTLPERVLFKNDGTGHRAKTNAFSAIETARTTPQTIFFAALSEVRAADLSRYFAPYTSHAQNPYGHLPISVWSDKQAENAYVIPENLWFVLNLAKEQSPSDLPAFIVDAATVNTFAFDSCKPTAAQPHSHKFTYYQMEFLIEKVGTVASVQEDQWKKVDRLVEYVCSHRKFHVGNKLWLHFEKYVLTLLSCGTDINEALDIAISAKLLPPIMVLLKDDDAVQSDRLLQITEDALGEEYMQACKQLLRLDSRKSVK